VFWLIEIACLPFDSALFDRVSGFFPRNRLAVQALPPGGSSVMSDCFYFGLNRLAAMSFCQAA